MTYVGRHIIYSDDETVDLEGMTEFHDLLGVKFVGKALDGKDDLEDHEEDGVMELGVGHEITGTDTAGLAYVKAHGQWIMTPGASVQHDPQREPMAEHMASVDPT